MTDKTNENKDLVKAETPGASKLMAVTDQGIALRSVDDAIQFCKWCVESGMLPPEINTPKKAFAIMARGAELGLKPFTSWRFIYMTKGGRLALESKGALAVCQGSPVFEDYQEGTEGEGRNTVAWAIAKRKGRSPVRKEFTYAQAERAGLADEKEHRTRDGRVYKTVWQGYLEDMLLSKARARALDVTFADVLGGMPIRGEAEDIDAAEQERNGGQGMPRRDTSKPAARDTLLDDLGPATPEDREIIDAQVNEIFPKKDPIPQDPLTQALVEEEYEGEVTVVEDEPEEPPTDEELSPQEEEAAVAEETGQAAECEGCGTIYHVNRAACPECGLPKGSLPGPPSRPKVEEDSNPFEKGRKQAKKLKEKAKSKGQGSLLDK